MNMLRPSMASMLKPGDNYYAFVVAVAKHARELAQEAEDSHEIMEEKPVKKSVEDFPLESSVWARSIRRSTNKQTAL